MTVERLLQLHIAALAGLGTLLLGMGQRNPILPVVAIFAALTSVVFTDRLRWFVLSRTFGNLAALAAVVYSSFEFWTNASEAQLLAIANLLVYLQIVLLYQQKNATRYWEIAVLSLLQVVVAAALNLGFEFGLLLLVYMLTAFSALALFFVYREGLRYCAPDEATLETARKRSLRRKLLGDPVSVVSTTAQSTFAGGIIGWNFARHVVGLSVLTMVFTVVLFFSVPRTTNAVWQGSAEGQAQVGFSQEVDFNERGQIRQSDEVVMRVTFRKEGSDKPIMIAGDPYFYGTVLGTHDRHRGRSRWTILDTYHNSARHLTTPPSGVSTMRMDIVLNPLEQPNLFYSPPMYMVPGVPQAEADDLHFDWKSGELTRPRQAGSNRAYAYSLATTGFRDNWQLPVSPHARVSQEQLEHELNKLLEINGPERFPQLMATADRIIQSANVEPDEVVVKARLLQDHFRTPNAYNYTLDFTKVPRSPDVDPLEDFVANHHTGHCEYFAGALCLMLRSQGIPARIVVGYKGGEFNSVGGYYWVRQLHAHAWVEAYLTPDQIPPGTLDGESIESGAWLRLDPTPVAEDPAELALGVGLLARVGDAMDYVQLLWDDYILGLNSERQQKTIFKPLTTRATSALSVFSPQQVREALDGVMETLGLEKTTTDRWFSWRAGVAGSVIAAIILLLGQGATALWRLWRQRSARQQRTQAAPPRRVIEFYQRLERLLEELGIERQPHQTQREFALAAGDQLASLSGTNEPVSDLPLQIVEAFYRVRFGQLGLTQQQAEAIDAALGRMQSLQSDGDSNRSPR